MTDELAGIGHNKPPVVDPEILLPFHGQVNAFADAAGQWLDRGAIESEENAERLNDFLKGLSDAAKEIDAKRVDLKRPHDEAAKAVQSAFAPLLAILKTSADRCKPLLETWALRKKAEAEEAKRQELTALRAAIDSATRRLNEASARNDVVGVSEAGAELAEIEKAYFKAGGKKVTAKIASASGGGRTRGLKRVPVVRLDKVATAAVHFKDNPALHDLLISLATSEASAGETEIPGFTITFEDQLA